MSDTTIKVDSRVRDRLALLAAQRGTSLRDMVASLAEATPTREELDARYEAATSYLREHLAPGMTEAHLASAEHVWQELAAGRTPRSLDATESP